MLDKPKNINADAVIEALSNQDAIDCVMAVAEQRGFTEAAKALGCSKSHVSKQVSLIENLVGGQLFARTTRRLAVTRFGEQFIALATEARENLKMISEKFAGMKEAPEVIERWATRIARSQTPEARRRSVADEIESRVAGKATNLATARFLWRLCHTEDMVTEEQLDVALREVLGDYVEKLIERFGVWAILQNEAESIAAKDYWSDDATLHLVRRLIAVLRQ